MFKKGIKIEFNGISFHKAKNTLQLKPSIFFLIHGQTLEIKKIKRKGE